MKKTINLLLLIFFATSMYAGGFRVALQSAKQTGMGYTGAGLALGTESIYFNPGAIAFGKGGVSVSGHAILADIGFSSPGTSYQLTAEKNLGTPFAIAGTYNVTDKVSAGLAVYTPYGSRLEWEDGWAGSYVSEDIDLALIFAQPTISYKVNEKLGVGAGLVLSTGTVTLEKRIPITTPNGDPTITLQQDEAPLDFGYRVGAFYQPIDAFSVGVDYRSKVDATVEDGTVALEGIPTAAQSLFKANRFDATLPLPAELTIGTGIYPSEKLTIAADMNYSFWSGYKELAFKFNDVVGGADTSVTPQNWEDSVILRIGGAYEASDKFTARAGGYLDFTPIPDSTLGPITPDQDKVVGTLGLTYTPIERFEIDASYLAVDGRERTVSADVNQANFGQRYKINANVFGLGLNYKFDK